MSNDAIRELLRPYLPIWLRERIGVSALPPGSIFSCEATILYADLSGFTRLTASFADLPDGAERLYESLNRLYNALVETILAHAGDVVSIAGDALTAWWPEQVDLELGRRCGEAMQAALAAMAAIDTPAGPFRLDLRVGVAAGPTQAALAGLPSHGVHLVLLGPALAAATLAERTTAPGTTSVVRPALAPVALLVAPPAEAPSPGSDMTALSEEHFLPPTFVERLRLDALIAEYRRCVPVFAAFDLPIRSEDLHSLVARAQAVTLRWGGWLNEVEVGDKGSLFVLLFGAPVAHGDDATRAVGCCIELRERGLITQAAITAGTLFVGAVGGPQRRVYTARGDEMNLAAHLLLLAATGEILVSGRVREEIIGRYWVSAPEEMLVKGHENLIPVARINAEQASTRLMIAQPSAPLIGRERERRALRQALQDVVEGTPRLVLLEGEAGIGKSTLLHDLLAHWRERGLVGISAASSNAGQALPLQAWRPIALTLCEHEVTGEVGAKGVFAEGVELLRSWLDTHTDLEPQSLLDALVALVLRRLKEGPLLICIEDIHWADDRSLELIGLLLNAPHPLLIAVSYRPFALPRLEQLHAHPAAVPVRLHRLNDHESEEMMRLLLGADTVEPHLAYDIYTHTDGQPLFIKESLLALRQRNLITIDDGGQANLVRASADLHASDSALAIVQATVDQLDEETRLTLKVAAVIGRSFPLPLLLAIHPAGLHEARLRIHLAMLVQLELVDLEFDGPEQVYRFKYQVTHDVAYTSLLFGQRRALHAAVARWYERAFHDEVASDQAPLAVYDVLIEHLRLAEETTGRVRYCRAAALRAARQYAPATALSYLDSALPLTTDLAAHHDLILLRVAINDRWGNQFTQAEYLSTLEGLTETLNDPLRTAFVAFYKTRYLLAMGLYQTALASAQRAGVLSQQARRAAHSPHERQQALVLRAGSVDACGVAQAALGNLQRAASLHQRALALCEIRPPDGLPDKPLPGPIPSLFDLPVALVQCLNNLGALSFNQGELANAESFFTRALENARLGGDWIGEARAREQLGRVALARHDYASAEVAASSALATGQASGDRLGQTMALHQLSAIALAQGQLVEAQRFAIHAHVMSMSIGARALEARILLDIAEIAHILGLDDEAAAARTEAERARGAWWRTEMPAYLPIAVG